MNTNTRLSVEGETALVETEDPDVRAQLEELADAEQLGEGRFSLSLEAVRIHLPHLAA
jgi:hypothetical protein